MKSKDDYKNNIGENRKKDNNELEIQEDLLLAIPNKKKQKTAA